MVPVTYQQIGWSASEEARCLSNVRQTKAHSEVWGGGWGGWGGGSGGTLMLMLCEISVVKQVPETKAREQASQLVHPQIQKMFGVPCPLV